EINQSGNSSKVGHHGKISLYTTPDSDADQCGPAPRLPPNSFPPCSFALCKGDRGDPGEQPKNSAVRDARHALGRTRRGNNKHPNQRGTGDHAPPAIRHEFAKSRWGKERVFKDFPLPCACAHRDRHRASESSLST